MTVPASVTPLLIGADAIVPTNLPGKMDFCMGYVGGHWPDYAAEVTLFPQLAAVNRVVPVAVNAGEQARILDCETGDATPDQCGPWLAAALKRGVPLPGVYANEATMPAVLASITATKVPRSKIVLMVAKWDGVALVPPGFEAKQYMSFAKYDADVALPSFFPQLPGPSHTNIVHYNWFQPVRVFGKLFHEGAIVYAYDKLRQVKQPSFIQQVRLSLLVMQCKLLAGRLNSVIAARPVDESRKARRFYRRAQLYARAAGHQLV